MTIRSCRFPRTKRLTSPVDYQEVFKSARRFTESCLILLAKPNGRITARLGMALSRKRIPTAAQRNRIKRLIRESFRRENDRLSGLDVVVLVRGDPCLLDNHKVNHSLETLWSRLEQCRKSPWPVSVSTDVG